MPDWEALVGPFGVPTATTSRTDPHDAGIRCPATLHVDHDAWRMFGSIDQARVEALDGEFGGWAEGAAPEIAAMVLADADVDARRTAERAFEAHLSNRGATYIDAALYFRHQRQVGIPSSILVRAEACMARLASIAQWDLYHLVGAPDIAVFHGGKTPLETRRADIARGNKLYAGYSWTTDLDAAARYGRRFTQPRYRFDSSGSAGVFRV